MDKKIKVTLIGSIINLLLPPLKFIAGYFGHSGALIADGIHSLSDLLSDLVVYIFVSVSNKPRDKNHDYGHGKFETVATLFISVMLFVVSLFIAYSAVMSFVEYFRDGILPERPGWITLIVALISIISKEFAFRITRKVAIETRSDAIMANAWHHRSDAYSSIATVLGIGGAILIGGVGLLLEPLAALIVAGFIFQVGIKLGTPALHGLTDTSLGDDVEEEILAIIRSVPGVNGEPHNLRTRMIGNEYGIEVDICVDGDMTVRVAHALTEEIERKLRGHYSPSTHIVIHVEPDEDHHDSEY